MDKDTVATALITTAAIFAIACGIIYLSDHVSCFNFFGMAKGCVTH